VAALPVLCELCLPYVKVGGQFLAMKTTESASEVEEAARAAADGDPGQLMQMMDRLLNTREGAELVERISRQAKESGLS